MCEILAPVPDPMTANLVITRLFAAPREQVFRAWTEPDRLRQWWGPSGFTCPVCRIDPRPGGIFHSCMRSTDGQEFWSTGVYHQVEAPERLVCTDSFADADGNVLSPLQFGLSESWPEEALLSLSLVERDGQTEMTLVHGLAGAAAPELEMCRLGWSESLDKLATHLSLP